MFIFSFERYARVFEEWGAGLLWKKLSLPSLFANVCGETQGLHSFQGSVVDFDGAKAKCASFSMTLATFDDAAEVDKIYDVMGG